jgi:hypothetical protein
LKALNWIAWISAGFGFFFILFGLIQILIGAHASLLMIFPNYDGRLMGDTEVINFFIASANFFIITIAMILFQFKNQSKKG